MTMADTCHRKSDTNCVQLFIVLLSLFLCVEMIHSYHAIDVRAAHCLIIIILHVYLHEIEFNDDEDNNDNC